ncbi:tetratricopeptide repeat protein [Sabulicella rubraurantiaca]|uniref:tetratricopeptide repeat protein n=1 Tax=Sabulicella rubraurantiaca TaxID=2811429 RepID=UPI001A95B5E6|nr:tetratricopeptide repeat protein [Sabulicella rubraurantiaca]
MKNVVMVGSTLALLLGAPTAFAQNAPKPGAQANALPDWRAAPRYATLNLRAGFQPDPREVQVDAGGPREARAIRPDCAGWIDFTRPDVDLNYEPGQYPLVISATSATDTTIVVNDPAGNWHCNDDLVGLDPGVVFQRPLRGNYNIWVGTLDRGRPQRATVRVSEVPPRSGAPGANPSAGSSQSQAPAAAQPVPRPTPRDAKAANMPPAASPPRTQPEAAIATPAPPSGVQATPRAPLRPLPTGNALLAYTRQVMGPALAASVPLAPTANPNVLRADIREPGLPTLTIAWSEQDFAVEASDMASWFEQGVDGQCQARRTIADQIRGGVRFTAFTTNCPGAGLHLWMVAGRDAGRTQLLVLAAPSAHADAVLARGRLLLQHWGIGQTPSAQSVPPAPQAAARPPAQAPAAYQEPPNYAQLRADCADDSDAPRQIAGCEAVLANPAEANNRAIALNNRGHARERGGDIAAALADYDRAIAQDPSYVRGHVNRARMLARLGRTDEAIVALDRSIAVEDDGWARLERGKLLASRNEWGRALADLDAAARLLPDDEEARQARDWARLSSTHGIDFNELAPPAATLAEAVLSVEGFSGLLQTQEARVRRDGPNRVSADWPTMPSTGTPGRFEVEVRSCSEVIFSEIVEASGASAQERRVLDLTRLRGLLSRRGDDFVYAAGAYGERTRQTAGGPLRMPIETSPGAPAHHTNEYAQALVYHDAIHRFCPGVAPAAQAAQPQPAATPASPTPQAAAPAPAPAQAATTTMQVETVSGLSRDQPFSFSYPGFLEQFATSEAVVALRHPQHDLEVYLTIEPASPGSSAASAQARFQPAEATAAHRRTNPDFVLNGPRGVLQLPAGPAFVYQGALTSMAPSRARLRYMQSELYDGGRRYGLAIYVGEDIYESARPLIGFLLANLSPSSAPRQCCADPVALP